MVHNYAQSIIMMFTDGKKRMLDCTTQEPRQRLSTLRSYYRYDPKMKDFFDKCQIQIIQYYPCKSRFELNHRMSILQLKLGLHKIKDDTVKQMCQTKVNMYLNQKKAFEEPESMTIYLDR